MIICSSRSEVSRRACRHGKYKEKGRGGKVNFRFEACTIEALQGIIIMSLMDSLIILQNDIKRLNNSSFPPEKKTLQGPLLLGMTSAVPNDDIR